MSGAAAGMPEGAAAALALAAEAKAAAAGGVPFSEAELDRAVESLKRAGGSLESPPGWAALRGLLQRVAHQSHKDWARTGDFAQDASGFLAGPDEPAFSSIFRRVLEGGRWPEAAAAAAARPASAKPWAVLVTGLNGIRKTSSLHQTWFKEALAQALADTCGDVPPKDELPDASDSFFRQLDYIIATVANEDFRSLYKIDDVDAYAAVKDSIFARYRTVAEMWGVLLVREAQKKGLSVMVETSGRDIAMFHYVDQFFPDEDYRKLVLNFEINDISFAETSVDTRMQKEMQAGRAAIERSAETMDIISVNAGGPYGSKVLAKVQEESRRVWQDVLHGGKVAGSWYKASFLVEARQDGPWTVRAGGLEAAGSREAFEFAPL